MNRVMTFLLLYPITMPQVCEKVDELGDETYD